MFSTSTPQGFLNFFDALEGQVTPMVNKELLQDFTGEEVTMTFWQMHPTKTPGPDEMSPLFFSKILACGKARQYLMQFFMPSDKSNPLWLEPYIHNFNSEEA